MIEFCHLAPTSLLDRFATGRKVHLLLAHLIENDPEYRDWYRVNKMFNPSQIYIMDNSGFEMYKQNKPMYTGPDLIELAKIVNANYVVIPDYPNEPAQKTRDIGSKVGKTFKDNQLGTFFCPQSKINDLNGLLESFHWASNNPLFDYIGFSILAIPNAFGVEKDNKLQRFLSRWKFIRRLEKEHFFKVVRNGDHGQKLHLLGMVDGPNEIDLLRPWLTYFNSWDSSAAIWAGLNGITFDNSPTGLINGKFEKEVDFSFITNDYDLLIKAMSNVIYIDEKLDVIY